MAFTPPPPPRPKMPVGWYGQYNPKYDDACPQEVYDLVNSTDKVTTPQDIARHFNTNTTHLKKWVDRYKDFAAAMQYVSDSMQNKLVKACAEGEANQGQIFLLKTKCGFIEAAQERKLMLEEAELKAKLAGKIDANGNRPINITFTEVGPELIPQATESFES